VTFLHEYRPKPFHFAIVDEVDSVLIDEGRNPLLISGEVSSKVIFIAFFLLSSQSSYYYFFLFVVQSVIILKSKVYLACAFLTD